MSSRSLQRSYVRLVVIVALVLVTAVLIAGSWPGSASAAATARPVVTGAVPFSGYTVGGNPVVITGSGFIGVTRVSFGGANAPSFTVDSPTQITAVAPAHRAGVVFVRVTAAGGTSRIGFPSIYVYVLSPAP